MPAVKQEGDGQGWKYESVKEDRRKDVERERERTERRGAGKKDALQICTKEAKSWRKKRAVFPAPASTHKQLPSWL